MLVQYSVSKQKYSISAVEANDRGNNVNAEVQIDQKKNRTEQEKKFHQIILIGSEIHLWSL